MEGNLAGRNGYSRNFVYICGVNHKQVHFYRRKKHTVRLWCCALVLPVIMVACSGKANPYRSMLPESRKGLEKQFYFLEGLKHYELHDLNTASALFRLALRADTTCAACYYKLAEIYFQSGFPKEAAALCRSALALDSANVWYRILLGKAYSAGMDIDRAIATFEAVAGSNPEFTETYYRLAALYAGSKQPEKALLQLDSLENRSGVTDESLLLRFEILQDMGNAEAAMETLVALGQSTSDVRIFAMLGETYNNLNRDSLALLYFTKALDIAPDYPPALFGEADLHRRLKLFDVYFQKLYTLYANKDIPVEMKTEYLAALLKVSQFVAVFRPQLDTVFTVLRATPNSTAELLYGTFLIQSGKGDEALTVFENTTQLFPTDTTAWETFLGFLYYRQQWDSLNVQTTKAISIFPEQMNFIMMKAVALSQKKEPRAAINLLEKTLAAVKHDAGQALQIYSFLGDLYHTEDNSKKAFRCYEKALAIDSVNVLVLNNYAYYLSLGGKQLDKAYTMSQKTITAEPDNATYLDTFGWILYKMGKFIEAKAIFRHAMIYGGTDSAVILDHYADVLHALGEKETAVLYWEMSYKKEPDPLVKKKIQ
jgi:tetratricopeptide (TPR) repeat protein